MKTKTMTISNEIGPVWIIHCYRGDVQTVDPKDGSLSWPCVSMLSEAHSCLLISTETHLDEPSAAELLAHLDRATTVKAETPHTLVCDNSKVFSEESFRESCRKLGIAITKSPPQSPQF